MTYRYYAVLAAVFMSTAVNAHAQEVEISGRNVQYYTDFQLSELSDENGRKVGTYQSNGVGFHGDGEMSTHFASGEFNHVDGEGTQSGRVYRTYPDGATIVTLYEGEAFRTSEGRRGKGTFTCLKGTGRFENIRCEGTYTSHYLDNDMTVTDWEGRAWFNFEN